MELGLEGKSVLVTGASKGIGAAVVEAFAAEAQMQIHAVARSHADLVAMRDRLSTRSTIHLHAVDLAQPDVRAALADELTDVDILVNNAGAIPTGSIDVLTDEQWRVGWELKVWGYIDLTRRYLQSMRSRGGGVIVNNIGAAGERHDYNYVAGTTANAALMAFTRIVGSESIDDGVRIVGLNTGIVETPRFVATFRKKAEDRLGSADEWRQLTKDYPGGRAATSAEVADAIVFLASARSSFTSGTIMTVDGGLSRRTSFL